MARLSWSSLMELRQATPQPVRAIAGVATMGIVLLAWWFLTWGATAEERHHLASRAAEPDGGRAQLPVALV